MRPKQRCASADRELSAASYDRASAPTNGIGNRSKNRNKASGLRIVVWLGAGREPSKKQACKTRATHKARTRTSWFAKTVVLLAWRGFFPHASFSQDCSRTKSRRFCLQSNDGCKSGLSGRGGYVKPMP